MCDNPNITWLCQASRDTVARGRETRYLFDIKYHVTTEHMDTINQVEAEMRREVLARKEANFGVEDPVLWERYYKTNCKLRRGPS